MWYTFCAKSMILIDRIVTLRSRSPCGERGLKYRGCRRSALWNQSLPVRGAWIEISPRLPASAITASLPVRGAWIEISAFWYWSTATFCRSPCGERGLKSEDRSQNHQHCGRSPCGERGLKCDGIGSQVFAQTSLPVRGAWIEMTSPPGRCKTHRVAPRAGSVD